MTAPRRFPRRAAGDGTQRTLLLRAHPARIDIPAATLASLALLYFGLTMPLVEFSSLLSVDSRYSILSGLQELWRAGDHLVVGVIFVLSVVFPVVKLAGLTGLWLVPGTPATRHRLLRLIEPMGKWSMLDVLVVILFAGAVRLGLLAEARTMHGAYVYAAAILLSMLAAMLMAGIVRPHAPGQRHPRARSILLPIAAAAGLAFLAAGIYLPLMEVEKWIFWQQQYSILGGALELARANEIGLAIGFVLFVIVLPALVQLAHLALALVQLTRRGGGRALQWLLELDRWAMLDVFALALFIAALRLGSWTELTPRAGLWCLAAALVLSTVCSVWLRWLYREKDRRAGG